MNRATGLVLGSFVIGSVAYLIILPDDKRAQLVVLARADIGKNLSSEVWAEVNPELKGKSWCGAWYLSKLRAAGLTTATWKDRIGFVSTLKLPRTTSPKSGDLAYKDKPNQHYAMVVTPEPFVTVDGNGIGGVVSESTHSSSSGYIFYSIEPLLKG